jgi:hypothetical protein
MGVISADWITEFNDLVGTPVKDRLQHVECESFRRFDRDLRRHRELHAVDDGVDNHRPGDGPILSYVTQLPPKPDKPEPNRRFRTRSALGRAGLFLDDLPIHIRPDLPARVQTQRTQWIRAITART